MTDFNRTDLAAAIEALQVTVGNLLMTLFGSDSHNVDIAAAIIGEDLYSAAKRGDYENALQALDDAVDYLGKRAGGTVMDFRIMQVREEIKASMPVERTMSASHIRKNDKVDIGGTYHLVTMTSTDGTHAIITLEHESVLALRKQEPVTVLTER